MVLHATSLCWLVWYNTVLPCTVHCAVHSALHSARCREDARETDLVNAALGGGEVRGERGEDSPPGMASCFPIGLI